MKELLDKIDLIAQMLETIAEHVDLEKGGPGSGCSGPNCGRKPSSSSPSGSITDSSDNKPLVVPGRGVRDQSDERIVVGSKPVRLR